jgi:RimJ/RimL family protein N-acetyltransferase
MVRIAIPNGKIRELERKDLQVLSEMSEEQDVRDFFYVDDIPNFQEYWDERLESQLWYGEYEGSVVRASYDLPIEVEGNVRGLMNIRVYPYTYETGTDDCRDIIHTSEVSFFIGTEHRKQGIAERSLKATIPFVFRVINSGIVSARVLKENIPSQNLLAKIGLEPKWEGVKKYPPGVGREMVVYGLGFREQEKLVA